MKRCCLSSKVPLFMIRSFEKKRCFHRGLECHSPKSKRRTRVVQSYVAWAGHEFVLRFIEFRCTFLYGCGVRPMHPSCALHIVFWLQREWCCLLCVASGDFRAIPKEATISNAFFLQNSILVRLRSVVFGRKRQLVFRGRAALACSLKLLHLPSNFWDTFFLSSSSAYSALHFHIWGQMATGATCMPAAAAATIWP